MQLLNREEVHDGASRPHFDDSRWQSDPSSALVDFYKALEQELDGGPPVDRKAFDACIDASVDEVVAQQIRTGIDIPSDGEFSKGWLWANYTIDRVSGLEQRTLLASEKSVSPIHGKDRSEFAEFYADYDQETRNFFGRDRAKTRRWTVSGPIRSPANRRLHGMSSISRFAQRQGRCGCFHYGSGTGQYAARTR